MPSTVDLCRRLNELSERLVVGSSAEEITQHLLRDVVAMTGGERAVLVRFAGSQAEALGLVDRTHGEFSAEEAEFSSTVVARVREEGRPLLVTDTGVDQHWSVRVLDQEGVIPGTLDAPTTAQARA